MKLSMLVAALAFTGILAACNSLGGAPGGFNPNATTPPGGQTSPVPPGPTMAPSTVSSLTPLPIGTNTPGPIPSPT